MSATRLFLFLGLIALFTSVAFAQGYGYGYPESDDGGHHELEAINVNVQVLCNGTTITVTDGSGAPVNSMIMVATATAIYYQQETGDDGIAILPYGQVPCGSSDVEVIVNPRDSRYKLETIYIDFNCPADCQPVQEPQCRADSDCPATQQCTDGQCVPVQCGCGMVQNHQCVAYDCCSDSQCAANELCENHACNPKPAECTADAQCAAAKYCDIPAGTAGGSCKDVTIGDCGKVENHAFVPYGYECGTEPGCPSCPQDSVCVDHKCVQAELSCPSTGTVGDSKPCEATENGVPCANCDYMVTDPTGKESSGKTDEDGNFDLPLTIKGTYTIALLKDGVVLKLIQVQAFPEAAPEEPVKPTSPGLDLGVMVALLFVLLLLAVGLVLYWRSRGSKK